MALYVLVVYPNGADDGTPATPEGTIGPFGTEGEARAHAEYIQRALNPLLNYDVYPLEFPI